MRKIIMAGVVFVLAFCFLAPSASASTRDFNARMKYLQKQGYSVGTDFKLKKKAPKKGTMDYKLYKYRNTNKGLLPSKTPWRY